MTTLAGSGTSSFADGIGTAASFYRPYGVAVDASSNVIVCDRSTNRIRLINPLGAVTTIAGSGLSTPFADGIGTVASFGWGYAVAVDSLFNIYIADDANYRVRKISPSAAVTTFAGRQGWGYSDGVGTNALFTYPFGMAFDSSSNLFVADNFNHRIRKISSSAAVTTFLGLGFRVMDWDNSVLLLS